MEDNLKDEYIPYEQALELKELGFDEPCFKYWNCSYDRNITIKTLSLFKNEHLSSVGAPIFSQAFRWFREKYNLHVIIDETVRSQIKNSKSELLFEYFKDDKYAGFTYKEAELACLNELIKITINNIINEQ